MDNMPADKEALLALPLGDTTVADALIEQTGKIGEKIEASSYELVEGEKLASYIHAGSKIGVLVNYKDGGKDGADQFFKGVAMHIAAMKPTILSYEEFDTEFITKETMGQIEEKIKEELKAEGKPEQIWDKILPGKLERYIADNTLLDQEYCLLNQFYALDDSKTVADAVKGFHADAEIISFKRVTVGK